MQGREGRPPAELQEQSCETRGAVLTDTMALQPPPGWSVHLVTFSNTSKLGFELTQDREGVRIASVEEGGAAALSRRVFVGDRVASVNGVQPAAGTGIRELVPILQSEAVSLCLWRPQAGGTPVDGGALRGGVVLPPAAPPPVSVRLVFV